MGILKPAEIVEIGIEKEKKRRDFYALAADQFKDEGELSELFGKLRDWEAEHIRKFEEIRNSIAGGGHAEDYPGETEAYMNAIVESDLYNDINPESFAKSVKTPSEALDRGIEFEKDAILFFSSLSRFLDESATQVIKELIDEEREHILYLFNMKRGLS